MVIGVLQIDLTIDGSRSLKDKRRVVSSLKDRLHREHLVSVAEVASHDDHERAILGIVLAAKDVPYCQSVLDRVLDKVQQHRGYVLADHNMEILTGHQ